MTLAHVVNEQELVRITLPLHGHRTMGLDATLEVEDDRYFTAHFLPGQLPFEDLDFETPCNVTIEKGDVLTIIVAEVASVLTAGILRLFCLETVTNVQKREYFRIDSALMVAYRHTEEREQEVTPIVPVNISGGGIRFPVNRTFRIRDKISLKLFLEQFPAINAECIGQVVRVDPTKNGDMEIALKFIHIQPRDRDRIISYCFARQREQLRKRVQIKGGHSE